MTDKWINRAITRRWIWIFASALLIFVVLLLLNQRSFTVRVSYPERDVPVIVFGLGTIEARILSHVSFEVGATLIELNADYGDQVGKNAILARLHSAEQQARVVKANAGVTSAKASASMAKAMVEQTRVVLAQRQQTNRRQQRLLVQKTVSEEAAEDAQLQQDVAKAELTVALSEVEVAKARLADANAQLEYENVVLDHHLLRSPYDAVVVKRHHELGSVLSAGESLFTLVDSSTIWALAYVDESRAGDIRIGQAAEVHLRSLPRIVFAGQVARIDIESDRVNEERRVYIACDQCPENFHLGEQAEVFITTNILSEATLIPESAVVGFNGTSGDIWIVKDKQLSRRMVQFGARTLDGRLVIVDDLDTAIPVNELHSRLREGRHVKVTPAPQT